MRDGTPRDDQAAVAVPATRAMAADDGQIGRWIAQIAHHDEQALAALYDACAHRVHALVLRVLRSGALADEVVEDTFFQVWRQAVRYDPGRGRALAWLLGMARSRAIDALRREGRFSHASLDDGDDRHLHTACPLPGADDLLDAARSHAELHRALLHLNAQPRQLVALAFFRGLSHEEIASETALPLGTVKSQIRRALHTLRQALGEPGAPAMAR